MLDNITASAKAAISELLEMSKLKKDDIVVIGCSTSEVLGEKIGTYSSPEAAEKIFFAINDIISEGGMFLAAQCCEHLNRALIIEAECAEKYGYEIVNVVPLPKAGGSFAAAAYKNFKNPVAVEFVSARAGLDIGDTFIGMHLARVAVPVRLSVNKIGQAHLTAARVRPKFVGGERAVYDDSLM